VTRYFVHYLIARELWHLLRSDSVLLLIVISSLAGLWYLLREERR
jgi:hypothetical protein